MQFIWQRRFFGSGPFQTADGSFLEIINIGVHNFNQGPDFLNSRIKIGITEWAGNIELHIHASDWYKHKHQNDLNFKNIILHVVWINDVEVYSHTGTIITTFCIQPYVSIILLDRYRDLMLFNPFAKPCYSYLPAMSQMQWLSWKERLVVERLEKKGQIIIQYLKEAKQDWETVTWWLLAANMGLKVNEELFGSVARSIALKVLGKHRNQIHQIEAILMGQSNLLTQSFDEHYPKMLQREYLYLQKKYHFSKQIIQPAYLRMRPASFPTLRLAQLAKLIQEMEHWFDFFKNTDRVTTIQKKLKILPNDYWLYHYRFDDPGVYKEKMLGISMIDSIIINTVIPILYTYGLIVKETNYQEKAMNWLIELKSEKNCITNDWNSYRVLSYTAFDSQGLLELTNNYCKNKRCLDCAVGTSILGNQ